MTFSLNTSFKVVLHIVQILLKCLVDTTVKFLFDFNYFADIWLQMRIKHQHVHILGMFYQFVAVNEQIDQDECRCRVRNYVGCSISQGSERFLAPLEMLNIKLRPGGCLMIAAVALICCHVAFHLTIRILRRIQINFILKMRSIKGLNGGYLWNKCIFTQFFLVVTTMTTSESCQCHNRCPIRSKIANKVFPSLSTLPQDEFMGIFIRLVIIFFIFLLFGLQTSPGHRGGKTISIWNIKLSFFKRFCESIIKKRLTICSRRLYKYLNNSNVLRYWKSSEMKKPCQTHLHQTHVRPRMNISLKRIVSYITRGTGKQSVWTSCSELLSN